MDEPTATDCGDGGTRKTCQYVGSFPVTANAPTDEEDEAEDGDNDIGRTTRSEYVRAQLERMRESDRVRRPVLLVISLAGIKMCSVDGKEVFMAHALRRISYATCDSANRQFSFLARDPKGHFSLQHCHSFITESADQAEELNAIVGNAFRTAYLTQLQRDSRRLATSSSSSPPPPPQLPSRQRSEEEVVDDDERQNLRTADRCFISDDGFNSARSIRRERRPHQYQFLRQSQYQYKRLHNSDGRRRSPTSTANRDNLNNRRSAARNLNITIRNAADWTHTQTNNVGKAADPFDMNVPSCVPDVVGDSNGNPALIKDVDKPRTLLGLIPIHQRSAARRIGLPAEADKAAAVSSDDDDKNTSPIEPNVYRRLRSLLTPESTDNSPDNDEGQEDEELKPLVRSPRRTLVEGNRTGSSTVSFGHGGYVTTRSCLDVCPDSGKPVDSEASTPQVDVRLPRNPISTPSSDGYMDQSSDGSQKRLSRTACDVSSNDEPVPIDRSPFICQDHRSMEGEGLVKSRECARGRRTSGGQNSTCSRNSDSSSSCGSAGSCSIGRSNFGTPPPPLPDRYDSLQSMSTALACEETELRRAGWFQAGIPRDVALEILSQEPIGAFMVRSSESKPGCFALSLRVPHQPVKTLSMLSNENCATDCIAHYLIMRSNRGYKIKGFTKEFGTLTALITHHSVMPELLPCPLNLSRYNPTFSKHDSNQDFADLDEDDDPDYNTMADFCKMMGDVGV